MSGDMERAINIAPYGDGPYLQLMKFKVAKDGGLRVMPPNITNSGYHFTRYSDVNAHLETTNPKSILDINITPDTLPERLGRILEGYMRLPKDPYFAMITSKNSQAYVNGGPINYNFVMADMVKKAEIRRIKDNSDLHDIFLYVNRLHHEGRHIVTTLGSPSEVCMFLPMSEDTIPKLGYTFTDKATDLFEQYGGIPFTWNLKYHKDVVGHQLSLLTGAPMKEVRTFISALGESEIIESKRPLLDSFADKTRQLVRDKFTTGQ